MLARKVVSSEIWLEPGKARKPLQNSLIEDQLMELKYLLQEANQKVKQSQ